MTKYNKVQKYTQQFNIVKNYNAKLKMRWRDITESKESLLKSAKRKRCFIDRPGHSRRADDSSIVLLYKLYWVSRWWGQRTC